MLLHEGKFPLIGFGNGFLPLRFIQLISIVDCLLLFLIQISGTPGFHIIYLPIALLFCDGVFPGLIIILYLLEFFLQAFIHSLSLGLVILLLHCNKFESKFSLNLKTASSLTFLLLSLTLGFLTLTLSRLCVLVCSGLDLVVFFFSHISSLLEFLGFFLKVLLGE